MDENNERKPDLRALHALIRQRKVDVLLGELHEADQVIAEKSAGLASILVT